MPTNDTRMVTAEIINAYLEMALGIMALRVPDIQQILLGDGSSQTAKIESSYTKEHLILHISQMIKGIQTEGLENVKSLQNSFRAVNNIFLIAMWDTLFNHDRYSAICNEPEVQFLRHVRNGCGHGNRLNFGVLEKPAKWRDKEITDTTNGLAVFPDLLKDGDVILLIVDINNKFFTPIDLSVR